MPNYLVNDSYPVGRNATIIDTNVLLAAFWPADERHEDSRTFVFEVATEIIVPSPVLVETWGLLVGRSKRWDYGLEMLGWLLNPGNAVLLIDSSGAPLSGIEQVIRGSHVDCVDAYLVHLANSVTTICNLSPPITIATYDTSDYIRCRMKHNLLLRVLDLRSLETY